MTHPIHHINCRLLHERLESSAQQLGAKVAIIAEGIPHTYAELNDQSTALAKHLTSSNLQRGERVAVYMDNTWPCVVSIFAILKAGGVFIVINPQTKHDKLCFILEDSQCKILLSDAHLHPNLNPLIQAPPASLKQLIFSGEHDALVQESALLPLITFEKCLLAQTPELNNHTIASDLAALIYTSGSTGNPKGVMQTHLSMTFALESITQYLRLDQNDKILNLLPLAFDYGLYQLLMSINLGATLILERSFTYPAQILNRINELDASVFPGVPTIYSMLIAQYQRKAFTLPSITRVTNTAAALPKSMLDPLKKIFPNALIFKMYGLTECKRATYLEPELLDSHGDSVGKAIPGTEVFLSSPDGEKLPPGSEGILHIRGPHVMPGYWQRPEQSAHMLVPGDIPGERILCTHDLFRMDKDGFLYFIGRTDDIIKSRGEKVAPLEVEKVLLQIDGIIEAAVIGVSDATLGQAIKAFITVDKNHPPSIPLIKKTCLSQLENFMVPKYFEILDDMPKSPNGKIDKKSLPIELNKPSEQTSA